MSGVARCWGLAEEDRGLISLIRQELWEWRSVCQTPEHLLALGSAISGLDALLEGECPGTAVVVSLDRVVGHESRSLSVTLDEDALELGQSAYFYAPDVGGDGENSVDARFAAGEAPSEYGVFEWLNRCSDLRSLATGLEVEINQLPEV